MSEYTLAVGTQDPITLDAADDRAAFALAGAMAADRYAAALAQTPQDVVTLIGPRGLLTPPNERLDAFVARQDDPDPGAVAESPDCNGG